jgi:phage anti-repressor protein
MLVKLVFNQVLKVNCVDARELHAALEVKTRFNDWIDTMIDDTMAKSNVDFIITGKAVMENIEQLEGKNVGGIAKHKRKDYKLSISLAKEFAMLERNEVGKEVRKYFIKCEEDQKNKVQRVKGDEASKFHKLVLEVAIDKRQTLEGKTDHRGYCINIAKTVNLLCFGIHEPDIRQHMTRSFELRLNEINADVARLAIRGITKPKDVYAALAPKYTKQIAEELC